MAEVEGSGGTTTEDRLDAEMGDTAWSGKRFMVRNVDPVVEVPG